jgi:acyl carrier protein
MLEDKVEIIEKVINIIKENIETDEVIIRSTNLREDLDLDSFDVLMIMNEIDDEFSITLEEEDFQKVNTPQEITDLLKAKYEVK